MRRRPPAGSTLAMPQRVARTQMSVSKGDAASRKEAVPGDLLRLARVVLGKRLGSELVERLRSQRIGQQRVPTGVVVQRLHDDRGNGRLLFLRLLRGALDRLLELIDHAHRRVSPPVAVSPSPVPRRCRTQLWMNRASEPAGGLRRYS